MSWEVRTMQFGTSYFNKTLFAKHFARFWPIWGLYGLIWTVCLPLGILAGSRSGWMAADARVLPLNYLDTTGWFSAATLLAAVFGLLVVYCLRSVDLFSGSHGLPEAISIALVIALHVWKRQMLLSIAGGTVCYMLLVQLVF